MQEQQQNGARQTYVYDPDDIWSPLARLDQPAAGAIAEPYWFNTDLNGAPLEVTDEEGALRWAGQYGTFGEVRNQSAQGYEQRKGKPPVAHPLRYAGQYADSETGLHYILFRYYDPAVGRFTVQDPIGLAGGDNLYAYAPNPLGWIDPLGLSCGPSKGFNRRDRIAKRWTGRLSGKRPEDVHDYLTSKGWTATRPQASNDRAIQHIVYVKTTKSGTTYKLDCHPGGSGSQKNIHGNDYWKVYKSTEKGPDEVLGRISHGGFKNYDLIKDSPVYLDGVLMNGG